MAYPEKFEGYFCFMGGLHVEQVKGSGLDDIVHAASLDTVGLKTAVCDVSNIKKARYTLQVVAAALTKKLNGAFKTSTFETMELWIENQKVNPMFDHWFNVLQSTKIVILDYQIF